MDTPWGEIDASSSTNLPLSVMGAEGKALICVSFGGPLCFAGLFRVLDISPHPQPMRPHSSQSLGQKRGVLTPSLLLEPPRCPTPRANGAPQESCPPALPLWVPNGSPVFHGSGTGHYGMRLNCSRDGGVQILDPGLVGGSGETLNVSRRFGFKDFCRKPLGLEGIKFISLAPSIRPRLAPLGHDPTGWGSWCPCPSSARPGVLPWRFTRAAVLYPEPGSPCRSHSANIDACSSTA